MEEVAELSFQLKPTPPFRLDLTAWVLRRRPENLIDLWDGAAYSRIFFVTKTPILVSARQCGPIDRPLLQITAVSKGPLHRHKEALIAMLERTLGLHTDLAPFYEAVSKNPKIRALAERFIGFRPPRFPTVFEALANAISCQQLSVAVGLILLNRLARLCAADSADSPSDAPLAFPRPEQLAKITPSRLHSVGYSRQKTLALSTLASQTASVREQCENLEDLADTEVLKRLLELHGIGRWSAEYVMLRALGRLNIFPADDVAGLKALHHWFGLRTIPGYERARQLLQQWHPYQGLFYFHFLLARLEAAGYVQATRNIVGERLGESF